MLRCREASCSVVSTNCLWSRSFPNSCCYSTCERSFDNIVCARQERRGQGEAEGAGGLEVHNKLILGRRLHRKVRGLLTFKDAVHVARCAPVLVDVVRAIGNQTASTD